MRSRFRRIVLAAALVGGGGFLVAGPSTSCTSFTGETLLVATDFCFIFDCQNGILGGTINPCSGQVTADGDSLNVFADCPEENQP